MAKDKKVTEEVASLLGVPNHWINKYTLVTMLFMVWVTFFDQHNLFSYMRLQGVIKKMEIEKVTIQEEIAQAVRDKHDLDTDKEKFAREKHLMHKTDEEIIIIETNKKKK